MCAMGPDYWTALSPVQCSAAEIGGFAPAGGGSAAAARGAAS